jgi:hypothetical protein
MESDCCRTRDYYIRYSYKEHPPSTDKPTPEVYISKYLTCPSSIQLKFYKMFDKNTCPRAKIKVKVSHYRHASDKGERKRISYSFLTTELDASGKGSAVPTGQEAG